MAKRKRAFQVKDLFGHKALSGLTVSADGRPAAFVATQPDLKENKTVSEILAWAEGRGVWNVTFGGKASLPAFSPRGERLAFLSDRKGGKQQLHVMEETLSEGRQVTHFEEDVVRFEWSPDGRSLAVVAKADRTPAEKKRDEEKRDWWTCGTDERRRALWVVNAGGAGKPRRASADNEHVSTVAWTPDGKRLVYIACPVATVDSQWFESDLKVVDVRGGGRRTICPVRGRAPEGRIWVSADGNSVLLSEGYDDRDMFHDVAKLVELGTGKKRLVAPRADLASAAPQWLPDGRVLFECGVGTASQLCVCRPGGKPEALQTGAGVPAGAAVAREAGLVFYLLSETERPDEVWMCRLDGSDSPRPVTAVNTGMQAVRLARSEVVRWRSPDGFQAEGIVYLPSKPRARRPYPLIVMPHGGPYAASVVSYNTAAMPNIFCAAGYACFMPNFRGSTGYGRLFTRKIVRDWGEGPFADIMAGVDALIRRGLADGGRMAVFGGSYGGYVTTWTVGHTNRFRCAVAVAAVTNNVSQWGATDIPTFQVYSSGNVPVDLTDEFWCGQSPLRYAGRVKTPTLVITGEEDARVPPGQSHEFYRALKARGVETRLVLYPREPHGIGEPRHRVHYFEEILDWINTHTLKKG
jgi:dipeptidyl aminopeptidase/acylaminoacyl peptidase